MTRYRRCRGTDGKAGASSVYWYHCWRARMYIRRDIQYKGRPFTRGYLAGEHLILDSTNCQSDDESMQAASVKNLTEDE